MIFTSSFFPSPISPPLLLLYFPHPFSSPLHGNRTKGLPREAPTIELLPQANAARTIIASIWHISHCHELCSLRSLHKLVKRGEGQSLCGAKYSFFWRRTMYFPLPFHFRFPVQVLQPNWLTAADSGAISNCCKPWWTFPISTRDWSTITSGTMSLSSHRMKTSLQW